MERRGATMKLYLDDLRTPEIVGDTGFDEPDAEWVVVRSYHDAVSLLKLIEFEVVSLDHDLGTDKSGYDVLVEILEGRTKMPKDIWIHSWNPVGRARMEAAITAHRRRLLL